MREDIRDAVFGMAVFTAIILCGGLAIVAVVYIAQLLGVLQ